MRKKIRMLKRLFLRIASSCVINWTLWFIVVIGMIFDVWNMTFYKCLAVFLFLEVLFVDINCVDR